MTFKYWFDAKVCAKEMSLAHVDAWITGEPGAWIVTIEHPDDADIVASFCYGEEL